QGGLTVCFHQTHGFPVVFHRRLMGVADIMDTDLFVDHIYSWILIVRLQTDGIYHALKHIDPLFVTLVCMTPVDNYRLIDSHICYFLLYTIQSISASTSPSSGM